MLRGGSLGEHVADTLVMANYGYFQLQGQPGLFTLALAEGNETLSPSPRPRSVSSRHHRTPL